MNEVKQLQSRVRQLERALLPFALEAETWLDSVSDSYRPGVTEPRQVNFFARSVFTMRHLRRARELVRHHPEFKSVSWRGR